MIVRAFNLRNSFSTFRQNKSHKKNLYLLHNKAYEFGFAKDQKCFFSSNIVTSPFKEVEIPKKLITEAMWETVDRFPESTAMKCSLTGQTYTFSVIKKLSLRLANSFGKDGFKKGEIIALILPNCPDFPVIVLGALEAELRVTCVCHVFTADEIYHQLKDSGSVCVVAGPAQLPKVLAAVKKVEQATQSKPIRRLIVVDTFRSEAVDSGVTRFSEMIADDIDHSIKTTNSTQQNEIALLLYSSGTTGLSKGVCLSHRNIMANVCQIGAVKGAEINGPDIGQDILLGLLPFYHAYGLVVVLLTGLLNGGKIVSLPKFEPGLLVQTLEREKMSFLMVVPPILSFLGSYPKVTIKHLMNVKHIISATAPLGLSDSEKLNAKLSPQQNCFISQAYGLTETSPVATIPTVPIKNLTTVGAPVSNTLAKVIDLETGEAVGPNKEGEICFKGPQVMLGYHNNPEATAKMIDADGWLKTGDIGYYDEDSHFYIKERLKDLIKVKGQQVAPAELEEVLKTHPLVKDAGVIGVPDSRAGEVPVAFIVPFDDKLTEPEIKEFLSKKVSPYKQVSKVIFVTSIPKSEVGKVLRKQLRILYENHVED